MILNKRLELDEISRRYNNALASGKVKLRREATT